MQHTMIPIIAPVKVAPDTYLIPNLAVPVSSLVILGEEPIIVDTCAPVHRGRWLEMVYSLVDPDDIRWVFISHEGDHTGSLDQVLDAAPQATLVINMFSTERLALERPVHLERMIWREPGETFDALTTGVRPPWRTCQRTSTTSRSCSSTASSRRGSNSSTPVRYNGHAESVEALKPRAIASAHGPTLVGDAIHDAFDRVRTLGEPITAPPGQEALDEILASVIRVPAASSQRHTNPNPFGSTSLPAMKDAWLAPHSRDGGRPAVRGYEPARPWKTRIARARRIMSSSDSWPTRSPTLERGTVVILSTIRRLVSRSWLLVSGSITSRNSGASAGSVVIAQMVTDAVASKRSSWMMTTGRGLPT